MVTKKIVDTGKANGIKMKCETVERSIKRSSNVNCKEEIMKSRESDE